MVHKFNVRFKNGFPVSEPQAVALIGFLQRGMEVVPFEDLDTIEVGPEAGVAGWLGDVWKSLDKLGIPRPPSQDYPEALEPFLGRRVWQSDLKTARNLSDQKLFVKPLRGKLFNGFAFTGAFQDQIRLAGIADEEEPLWLSDAVPFVSEYRCFILRGEILDARHYKGDWSKALDRKVVEAAVAAWPQAPVAYCLDMGVVEDGRTLLVEVNDGYAMGSYGLLPNYYAQMLAARWEELTRPPGLVL